MGIPSYFSHILRNYNDIIIHYLQENYNIDNLYLDCNSIVYDAVKNVDINQNETEKFELMVINNVCEKIVYYINKFTPKKNIFIAFDGVAPRAKLDQQRTRRYKTWFQSELKKKLYEFNNIKKVSMSWNTSSITPGTLFMNKLNKALTERFNPKNKEKHNNPSSFYKKIGLQYQNTEDYNNLNIILSTSDEDGEGEHKIFDYIRNNKESHKSSKTIIYGLDADLIMLCLNHVDIFDKLYLHRETPEFMKSMGNTLDKNNDYLFSISSLDKIICSEMNMNNSKNYVFLCFLLGNDFLPHFPALNIRSDGIDKILNAFKLLKSKQKNFSLLNNDNSFIVWKNFRKLIEVLCEQEEQSFIDEYTKIKKMSNRVLQNKNENQSENLNDKEQLEKNIDYIILNYPSLDRSIEDNIDPLNEGWINRYYENLFNIENINDKIIKEICINYVEGLEWTFYYYNSGCPDWNWHYKYNYPPLLNDLIKYIPYFNTNLIHKNQNKNTISPIVQLSYVLPYSSLNLLPENIRKKLINNHKEWYRDDFELKWAFCKYIWESHVELPEIDIENIKKIII